MSDLPEPPVPPDLDLRGFGFMPLDALDLLESDLSHMANAEEFRAAVLLWCTAWRQVPAASLPDHDGALASMARVTPAKWKKIKRWALHGWEKHSDGRLYHHRIVEKALSASGRLVGGQSFEKAPSARSSSAKSGAERTRAYRERASQNAPHVTSHSVTDPVTVTSHSVTDPVTVTSQSADLSLLQPFPVDRSERKENGEQTLGMRACDAVTSHVTPENVTVTSRASRHSDGVTTITAVTDRDAGPTPEAILAAYPDTPHGSKVTAIHAISVLIGSGESTPDELMASVQRFSDFVSAGGVSDPSRVMAPQKFFARTRPNDPAPWSKPWKAPPPPKARSTSTADRVTWRPTE